MRVAIEWNLCVGSGLCLAAAQSGLRLAPYRGEQRALLTACPADDALQAAARACPMMAIRLADEAGQPVYPPAP